MDNPFLAGHPNGTRVKAGSAGVDQAPQQSPAIVNLPASVQWIQFDDVRGLVGNGPFVMQHGPEGAPGATQLQSSSSAIGIAGYQALPISSLVGVFLGPNVPQNPAPTTLFVQNADRNFALLSNIGLHQIFFIGDGLRTNGYSLQRFKKPVGATRLFLGPVDGCCWLDNTGSFSAIVREAVFITGSGVPMPGNTVDFFLSAAGEATRRYQVISSLTPGMTRVSGKLLRLQFDSLSALTVANMPAIVTGFSGALDGAGNAIAKLRIPNVATLRGLGVYTAFFTYDAAGIRLFSDTFFFSVS